MRSQEFKPIFNMGSLRDALRAGDCPIGAADDVACFLARKHISTPTHPANDDSRARTEAALFAWPFEESERCADAQSVREDRALVSAAGEMHAVFAAQAPLCSVHGDVNTGAAVLSESGSCEVVEQESFLGCSAVDTGTLFAHLLFAVIDNAVRGEVVGDENGPANVPAWPPAKPSSKSKVHGMISSAWRSYLTEARAGGCIRSDADDLDLLRLTAGFAGCELIRRVLGSGHADDGPGAPSPAAPLRAQKAALALGRKLLLFRAKLQDIDSFLVRSPLTSAHRDALGAPWPGPQAAPSLAGTPLKRAWTSHPCDGVPGAPLGAGTPSRAARA